MAERIGSVRADTVAFSGNQSRRELISLPAVTFQRLLQPFTLYPSSVCSRIPDGNSQTRPLSFRGKVSVC